MTRRRTNKRKKRSTLSLPDDLVTEVLLRVPAARSLARLRCVCRSWNTQIASRGFQEQHQALAAANRARFGLPPKFALLPKARQPCGHLCRGDCPRFVCAKPCRGVVLVNRSCAARAYSVCNPSTGGVLHLPALDTKSPAFNSAGIGFHAPTGEYKVAHLTVEGGWKLLVCNVLTVCNGGLRWRTPPAAAGFSFDHCVYVDEGIDPVFADGCLHWMYKTKAIEFYEPHGILSFSLADESFRRVPQPAVFSTADLVPYDHSQIEKIENLRRPRTLGLTPDVHPVMMPVGTALAELDGRLCVVRDVRRRNDVEALFQIWKLQEYDAGVWSMDYSISLTGHVAKQLTEPWLVVPVDYLGAAMAAGSRRKIVLVTSAHQAHVYDSDTNSLQTVVSCADHGSNLEERSDLLRLVPRHESLAHFSCMEYGRREIEFVDDLFI